MKVIKNINNNVSICVDDDGNELIAFGRGLGFQQPPYEIKNLSIIQRSFYDVDHRYFELLNLIPEQIFDLSTMIVDYAKNKINLSLSPNVVFTLADHINFAIKRHKQGLKLSFNAYHDLEYFNPIEVDIGDYAVKQINKQMNIELPREEAYGIALHFLNAESVDPYQKNSFSNEKIIAEVTSIIEKIFKLTIRKDDFNYSRFASHMEYLLERETRGELIESMNLKLFNDMKTRFPKTYSCAEEINDFFAANLKIRLTEEEKLYLMLHINRLCSREDLYK